MQFKNKTLTDLEQTVKKKEQLKIIKNSFKIAEKTFSKKQLQHCTNTAFILGKKAIDTETICAGLLHELKEDEFQKIKKEIIKKTNEEVASILEEIIKANEIRERNKHLIALALLGRVLFTATKDVRAIFVRIASGLERIRKMKKIKNKNDEFFVDAVEEIYVPIAHKLGLYKWEWQLRDFAFKIKKPREYLKIKKAVGIKRNKREQMIKELKKEMKKILEENKIKAKIEGRAKSFYGIYQKIRKGKKFSEIDDLLGVRIITENVLDCYKVLGAINERFEPTSHFHDYISQPKENNYQSIHTTIKYKDVNAEIQIRTEGMHLNAELGQASHWKYKRFESEPILDRKLSWARQLVDWQKTIGKKDFINSFKIEFKKNQVFVFTPKKEIIMLPENSSIVDFAFAIHSDLGLKCKKAKANGKIVPVNYKIQNGDEIKVIKGKNKTVKEKWLSFVQTNKAKNKIMHALNLKKTEMKKEKKWEKLKDKIITAECCRPLPGDNIIAYRTTKRKITIHRQSCKNIKKFDKKRIMRIEWNETKNNYLAKIKIKALNAPGMLIELLRKISKEKITLNKTETKLLKGNLIEGMLEIRVKNRRQFEEIFNKIGNTGFILKVERG